MSSVDGSPALAELEALVSVLPSASLLLAADPPRFTIVAASDRYLDAIGHRRESLVGRGLFEVFPEHPGEGGVDALRASLDRVVATERPHEIPLQRYDVSADGAAPTERYWREVNSPVGGTGMRPAFILHTVEDLTELVHRRAALDQANRRLADVLGQLDVLDQIGDGVIVLDRAWRITYVNAAGARMTGAAAATMLGHSIWEEGTFAAAAGLERILRQVATASEQAHFTTHAPADRPRRGAAEHWLEIDAYPLADGLAVFFRDVTERHRARAERDALLVRERAARDRAERLQKLAAALSHSLSRQDVADVIVGQITDALDGSGGGVVEMSDDGADFILLSSVGYASDVQPFTRYPVTAPLPVREVALTHRPVFLRSRQEWMDLCGRPPRSLAEDGEGAWAALPLLVEDELLGALTMTFGRPREFAPEERDFMMAFANQCAQALARARLFEAERAARAEAERANQRIAFLGRAGAELAASLDVRATLDTVARLAVPALADWCFMELFDDLTGGTGLLRPVAIRHADPDRVALAWDVYERYPLRPQDQFGSIKVARTGEPELTADVDPALFDLVAHDPEHARLLREAGFRSIVQVPLRAKAAVAGVLTFATTDESGRRYGPDDLALAEEVAARAGVALEAAALYAAEREARAAAEEANRAKSEFLAIMSHELRTPLNAIDGYAELMEMGIHGSLTEAQRDALARVRRSQKHLLGLINQVLNYARLETGAVRYELSDVPVTEILHLVEGLLAPQMRAKELRYVAELSADAPAVRADREKVQQILVNLLSNAVKFTPAGGRVTVEYTTGDRDVEIRVRDSGIGIPSDKLDSIFEPFVQVDARLARSHEGVGLGLAISRDLARGMGGNLTAESTVGAGSVFRVVLPRA